LSGPFGVSLQELAMAIQPAWNKTKIIAVAAEKDHAGPDQTSPRKPLTCSWPVNIFLQAIFSTKSGFGH
jgi:hypothetical protein